MMLPSVRRVASAAPASPILSSFGTLSRNTRSGSTAYLKPRHQRRWSSSKPSKDSGADELAVSQTAVSAAPEAKASEGKAPIEKRKRKAKESNDKPRLPSVPSTQNLAKDSIALSTFFSLHRPMSITNSLPRTVTEDAFASIFTPRTRAQKGSDIVSTLSKTIQELEEPMAKLGLGQHEAEAESIPRIELRHPSGGEGGVFVQVNAMSGHFVPFSPPPFPQPQSVAEAEAAAAAAEEAALDEAEEGSRTRMYKAVFTIEESTDSDGQVRIMAHSPELIEEEQTAEPRTFLERMAFRQLKHEEARQERQTEMIALSVKRQRKLKMKKKKYRKLLKNTRNERRKQDRL